MLASEFFHVQRQFSSRYRTDICPAPTLHTLHPQSSSPDLDDQEIKDNAREKLDCR